MTNIFKLLYILSAILISEIVYAFWIGAYQVLLFAGAFIITAIIIILALVYSILPLGEK